MSGDEERIRQLRDRVARMHQAAADEVHDHERMAGTQRAQRDREALFPSQGPRRYGPIGNGIFYVLLGVVAFVFAELGMTVAQYTGPDVAEAKRMGQATVQSCQRHGPVGKGFGYWSACTAAVAWDDGTREQVTPDKRRFFPVRDIGTTVTIGDLGYGRGGRSFARAELPPRPLVTVVAGIFYMCAVLIVMALTWIGWCALRDCRRRLTGTRN